MYFGGVDWDCATYGDNQCEPHPLGSASVLRVPQGMHITIRAQNAGMVYLVGVGRRRVVSIYKDPMPAHLAPPPPPLTGPRHSVLYHWSVLSIPELIGEFNTIAQGSPMVLLEGLVIVGGKSLRRITPSAARSLTTPPSFFPFTHHSIRISLFHGAASFSLRARCCCCTCLHFGGDRQERDVGR